MRKNTILYLLYCVRSVDNTMPHNENRSHCSAGKNKPATRTCDEQKEVRV